MKTRSKESEFRHALRNVIHTMGLCIAVIDGETDPNGKLHWLEQIEAAADSAIQLLDKDATESEPEPTTTG